jgi:hypothetical protein
LEDLRSSRFNGVSWGYHFGRTGFSWGCNPGCTGIYIITILNLKKDVFLDLCGFDGVGGAPMLANLVYN